MSQFSRAHYLHAAHWLRDNIKSEKYRATIVEHIADMFSDDNSRFDKILFYCESQVAEYFTVDVEQP